MLTWLPIPMWPVAMCLLCIAQWAVGREGCLWGRSGDGGPYLGGNKEHKSPMGGVCPGTVETL